MNNVGENIRFIRKSKGLSGKFVSKQVGIAPSTLSKYESNERKLKAELLPAIANVLGVKVEDFFAEKVGVTPIKSESA
jgi:transcriptional regulator with XRE-family HTH domain